MKGTPMESFKPPQSGPALLRETLMLLGLCVGGILVLGVIVYVFAT